MTSRTGCETSWRATDPSRGWSARTLSEMITSVLRLHELTDRLVILEEVDAESQSGDPNTPWILRGMSRLTPATGRGRAAGVSAT